MLQIISFRVDRIRERVICEEVFILRHSKYAVNACHPTDHAQGGRARPIGAWRRGGPGAPEEQGLPRQRPSLAVS